MKKFSFLLLFVFALFSTIQAQEKPKDIIGVPKLTIEEIQFALNSTYTSPSGLWTQKYLPVVVEKNDKEVENTGTSGIKFVENPKQYVLITFEYKDRPFEDAFAGAEHTLKISEELKKNKISDVEGSSYYKHQIRSGKTEISEDVYLRIKRIEKDDFKAVAYLQYFYPTNPDSKNSPKFDFTFSFPDIQLTY